MTEIASEVGVKYLTLYTFSTENWDRPQDEVDALMNLIVVSIEQQTPDLIKNNVRLTTIGDMSRMPEFASSRLRKCMQDTGHCTGLVLCLALNPADIDDEAFAARLATWDMPDPDLLIRTGGDLRVSNYLLWQIAYSELYFTSKYWPDFSKEDFVEAIADFQSRERRYGKTSEQVNNENEA